MPRKKRTVLDGENIRLMSKDRQKTLIVYRTILAETLKELVSLTHLLKPLQDDEDFRLELMSECGFNAVMTLRVDDYGDCPNDPFVAEALIDSTLALLEETKGAIMHRMEGATSIQEVEDELARRLRAKKGGDSKRRKQQLADIEERIKKRTKKPPSDMDISEIEALLDEVTGAPSKPTAPKPPAMPDLKKDYGFLG
jgi:hypothetical protein